MRIAQVSTSSGPVRQDQTGSVESLIWLLTRELLALGHEVTVFGCGDSEVPEGAEFVRTHPSPYGKPGTPSDWQLCDWMTLSTAVELSSRFDVLHSHAYLWGLPLQRFTRCPMVHTLHTMPYGDEALLWSRFPTAFVTGLSRAQWASATDRSPAAIIPHGVDAARFTFRPRHQGYLCYLGRFIPGKGPLEAIRASRAVEMPLLMAGPANTYFDSHVRPLVDGRQVQYIGNVNAAERDKLLGGAAALLYPLIQPEPFGLVQVEAMMCGTPVIAPRVGAVPEVVRSGVGGTLVENVEDMATAYAATLALPREAVRMYAEAQFKDRVMAQRYVDAYRAAVDAHARSKG